MAWEAYNTVFKLRSPMHVGWKKAGNVQYTRGYLPGSPLWGALTSRLVRDGFYGDYELAGIEVRRKLAFSYFFFSEDGSSEQVDPWGNKEREFSWRFQNSYASTALSNGYVKQDGSLHETEFISPVSRNGYAVLLAGTIFVLDGGPAQGKWKDCLGRVQIGGERSYGWGMVSLERLEKERECSVNAKLYRPEVLLAASKPIRQHLLAQDGQPLTGSVETVIRRFTDPKVGHFGSNLTEARFCWTPDSQPKVELKATITEDNLLALCD